MPCLPLPNHLPSHLLSHLVKVHAQEGGTVELACKVKFGHIICPIFVCPILHFPGYFCLQGKVWCNFFHNICCCLFLFVLFCIFRDIFARKILTSFVNHFLPFLFVLLCIFGDIFACKVNFGATFCLQVLGHLAYGTVCRLRLSFDTFFRFVFCLYNLVFSGLKPNFQGFNFFQAFLPCQNCILLKRTSANFARSPLLYMYYFRTTQLVFHPIENNFGQFTSLVLFPLVQSCYVCLLLERNVSFILLKQPLNFAFWGLFEACHVRSLGGKQTSPVFQVLSNLAVFVFC